MTIITSAIPGTVLALAAFSKKALTTPGIILAWFLCLLITVSGGIPAFVILAETFVFTVLADMIAGACSDPYGVRKRAGARGTASVICNVGIGSFIMLLMLLTDNSRLFAVYAAVMAESLADSAASKIGPLSKSDPIDIGTFKRTRKGLSGGVTLLGSIFELAGASVIALTFFLFSLLQSQTDPPRALIDAAIIASCGFAGAMFDSLLGSFLQVKFRCPQCGAITEKEMHCGKETVRISGVRSINNDCVNLLSNAFTALISVALLIQ